MHSSSTHCFGGPKRWTSVDRKVSVLGDGLRHLLMHSILRFCQGESPQGLTFETFYGDEWERNIERRFLEWSLRVFGGTSKSLRNTRPLTRPATETGTERRNLFLFTRDPDSRPEASSSDSQVTPEASSSSSKSQTTASSSQNSSKATASKNPVPRPSRPRKSVPPQATSDGVTPQPSVTRSSSPVLDTTPQTRVTSGLPQTTSTPASVLPNPPPPVGLSSFDGDMALVTTAVGVHQLLSQVVTSTSTSGGPRVDRPSQLVVSPSRLVVEPSQSTSERSTVAAEATSMDTQPGSAITAISSQLPAKVNPTSSGPTPKVPYRVRNPAVVPSEKPSRQGSIDGAPEVMVVGGIDDEQDLTVDLRDYVDLECDDESHVSSSQKTADGGRELSTPPPNSQRLRTGVGESTRTLPRLNIDKDDLPAWMVKKGQWKYAASTAGGTAWENLLKIYMNQERRLEFTEMVRNLSHIFPTASPELF